MTNSQSGISQQAQRALTRNANLYPWYVALYSAFFWMPVFFLYFSQYLTVAHVLQLEAIYYAAVVVMEVPSGWASDRLGRKPTLMVGAVFLLAGYASHFAAGWWLAGSFLAFAIGQVCLAFGIALHSGTTTSLHYESLERAGKLDEFDQREASVARITRASTALAALIGGALTLWSLAFAYAASALFAVVLIIVGAFFAAPSALELPRRGDASHADDPPPVVSGYTDRSLFEQLWDCVHMLTDPALRWLFGFSVAMTVLLHIPYEFYQPYLELLSIHLIEKSEWAGFAAGLHMAVATGLGAWAAGYSIDIRDRYGTRRTLLGTVVGEVALIGLLGAILHPVIAILILARSLPSALSRAPLNAAVTPRVDTSHRATYLSFQSLVGRLCFSLSLLGLSALAEVKPQSGGPPSWPALSELLLVSAVAGAVIAVLLLFTGPDDLDPPTHDHD